MDIEQRAKELFAYIQKHAVDPLQLYHPETESFVNCDFDEAPDDVKNMTKVVAKYVEVEILKARIDSLNIILKDLDPYFIATTLYRKVDNKLRYEIKEAEQQLTALEGHKGVQG